MSEKTEKEDAGLVTCNRRIAWEMAQSALTDSVGKPGVLDAPSEDDLKQLLRLYRRAYGELRRIQDSKEDMTAMEDQQVPMVAERVGDYFEYFAQRFPEYKGEAIAELVRITLELNIECGNLTF